MLPTRVQSGSCSSFGLSSDPVALLSEVAVIVSSGRLKKLSFTCMLFDEDLCRIAVGRDFGVDKDACVPVVVDAMALRRSELQYKV